MEHLVNSVEQSLASGNPYAALVVALTLPDICGWVEGVHARSKERYVAFFNANMAHLYTRPVGPQRTLTTFLTGEDFYALRCALVHEGRDDITAQKARQVLDKFQFVAPPSTLTVHKNLLGHGQLQLQADIFCREILSGAYAFLGTIAPNSDAATKISMLGRIHDMNGAAL